MRLRLEPRHEAVVLGILESVAPDSEVWAFGSRVHGRGLKPFSDLDLVVIGTGDAVARSASALRRAFEESSLPFRVDVAEWETLDEAFREIVRREAVRVRAPEPAPSA